MLHLGVGATFVPGVMLSVVGVSHLCLGWFFGKPCECVFLCKEVLLGELGDRHCLYVQLAGSDVYEFHWS